MIKVVTVLNLNSYYDGSPFLQNNQISVSNKQQCSIKKLLVQTSKIMAPIRIKNKCVEFAGKNLEHVIMIL
jgi:hypothetical protein